MSRLLEEHSACELREQWVAERYWPAGGAADNWRAVLIGLMVGQRVSFDKNTQRDIERIEKMLDGSFDPEKDNAKKGRLPGPKEMKMLW